MITSAGDLGAWSSLVTTGLVWLVMMAAMMLPSTLPWIAAFATLSSPGSGTARGGRVALFLAGYGVVWGAFSLAAAGLQLSLARGGALLAGGVLPAPAGGALLVGVGLFQLSPLKEACLNQCRSPLTFFLRHWHDGPAGAFRMGAAHGRYCLGCCWALMIGAFVLGVMNLAWMAALTVVVSVERLAPHGPLLGRVAGVAAIAVGAWMVLAGGR